LTHVLAPPILVADTENVLKDRSGNEKQYRGEMAAGDNRDHKAERDGHPGQEREEEEDEREGVGLTGYLAVVLFCAGNANALLSLVVRALSRLTLVGMNLKENLANLNRYLQKHIRKYHYLLNPLAAVAVSIHWYLTPRGVSIFQQWGTALAILLVISGFTLKYRLVPKLIRPRLFQLHTSPFMVAAFVSLVVLGHIVADD
jgi:hypothetical protein